MTEHGTRALNRFLVSDLRDGALGVHGEVVHEVAGDGQDGGAGGEPPDALRPVGEPPAVVAGGAVVQDHVDEDGLGEGRRGVMAGSGGGLMRAGGGGGGLGL